MGYEKGRKCAIRRRNVKKKKNKKKPRVKAERKAKKKTNDGKCACNRLSDFDFDFLSIECPFFNGTTISEYLLNYLSMFLYSRSSKIATPIKATFYQCHSYSNSLNRHNRQLSRNKSNGRWDRPFLHQCFYFHSILSTSLSLFNLFHIQFHPHTHIHSHTLIIFHSMTLTYTYKYNKYFLLPYRSFSLLDFIFLIHT